MHQEFVFVSVYWPTAAPVFKAAGSGPKNTNATVGDDVTFFCQPYANPDATVVWYLNGVALDRKLIS